MHGKNRLLIARAGAALLFGCTTLLTACGGGSSAPSMYTVGATVSGLASGANVVLQNSGGNNTTIATNGSFSFSTSLTNGMAYAVTVLTQPVGQTCAVASGSGTVSGANVTGIQVTCTSNTYTISGSVSGLNSGAQLTALNNAGDATTVTANGPFSFAVPILNGSGYAVTVQTQPLGQTCTVTSGSGTVSAANVTGIQVACTNNTYTISGTVSGLNAGGQLTVLNNAADATAITANGSFSFGLPILSGGAYAVTVLTQPVGQTCTVTSGSGIVSGANATAVQVACVTNSYTISGTVSGLNAGAQVTVLNNAGDPATVRANGPFTFAARVLYNGSYLVTIAIHPPAQTCTISAGAGAGVTSDVSGVSVVCSAAIESVIYSFDANADGVSPQANTILATDGNFYGTTYVGGTSGEGTVFKITPAGVETVLHSFTAGATDGSLPTAGLIQGSDGNFYGTTGNGGPTGEGTVFRITPSGDETVIFAFTGQDGIGPAGLVQGSDGNFYGTTSGGGPNFNGTVFMVTPAGVMTILHSFMGGADGRVASAALTLGSDGNFYGTTAGGGANDLGTVFKITPTGVETVLHSFSGGANDGISPVGALVLGADGNFYGTTQTGGPGAQGTVFKITSGGAETVLYSFVGGTTDGSNPYAALIQGRDGNFYGTTRSGGAGNNGTAFKITAAGVESVLHSFAGGPGDGSFPQAALTQGADGNFYSVNSGGGASNSGNFVKITPSGVETVLYSFNSSPEGQAPVGLVRGSDGSFYGTTHSGGTGGNGTVFKLTPDGIETALYSFAGGTSDGYFPSSLIQGTDGNFYGTTQQGGSTNQGTVFRITPAGAETILYSFTGGADGGQPQAALIQGSDGNFYGTSIVGGLHSQGTVFKITPSGLQTALYSFSGGVDGGQSQAPLIQGGDGNFYGTTSNGGANGAGAVFKITPSGVESVLYSFAGGADGGFPRAALMQAGDGNFYGTTTSGGASGQGTVFKVTPSGVETVLYSFAGGFVGVADGASPSTPLIQGSDGNFYGTSTVGGMSNQGILFKVTATGVETVLYYFSGVPDGKNPGALIQGADGKFFGTTAGGGSSGLGTVFKF